MIKQIILNTETNTILLIHKTEEHVTDIFKYRDVEIDGEIIINFKEKHMCIYPKEGYEIDIKDMDNDDITIFTRIKS